MMASQAWLPFRALLCAIFPWACTAAAETAVCSSSPSGTVAQQLLQKSSGRRVVAADAPRELPDEREGPPDEEYMLQDDRDISKPPEEPIEWQMLGQAASRTQKEGPGERWTEAESLIVMAKIHVMINNWGRLKHEFVRRIECYVPAPGIKDYTNISREPCNHFPSWEGNNGRGFGRDPTWHMMLRAGFHTCIPYQDGTGGCDGAVHLGLFPGGVFTQWGVSGNFHSEKHPDEGKAGGVQQNANMALLWDALEELYANKDFPPGAPGLNQSLRDSGKSRADLWAFATLLGAQHGFENHNDKCDLGKTLYDVLPADLRGASCKISLEKPLRFFTGREDAAKDVRPAPWTCASSCAAQKDVNLTTDGKCKKSDQPIPCSRAAVCGTDACRGCDFCLPAVDGTWRPRPYESVKPEVAAGAGMNGHELTDFFKKNFDFSKREAIAIMGAHSFADFHPPASGIHGYDWVHQQSDTLNNVYYRLISLMPSLAFEFAEGTTRTGATGLPYGVGGVNGEPVESAWYSSGSRSPSGPIEWFHAYARCPFCVGGKNIDRHRYRYGRGSGDPDRCCELCEKATRTAGRWPPTQMWPRGQWADTFVIEGLNASEAKWFKDSWCMHPVAVHENAITADLGLHWKIHYQAQNGAQRGPLDSRGGHLKWLWNDTTELNDLQDPGDLKMYEIVRQFAADQALWASTFAATLEKMLANGARRPLEESLALDGGISCGSAGGTFRCCRGPCPGPAMPGNFRKLGPGYCSTGYYAGWKAEDAADVATCASKCQSEPTCRFFSLNLGRSCSRYTSAAGDCSLRPNGQHDHVTYAKDDFRKLGPGYCSTGYYAGWKAEDAADVATCASKCQSEPTCRFFSLNLGRSCSRYTSAAGDCSSRPHGQHDHVTYAKDI